MSYCKECGKELEQGAKFCPDCGARVSVKAMRAPKKPQERLEGPQRIGKVKIAVIAVVVIVAVCVGSFLILKRGGSPGGLALYPGSQSWEIPANIKTDMSSDFDYAGYTVSDDSVQGVINWYKYQITDWTLENEFSGGTFIGDTLLYRKGDEGAVIWANDGASYGESGKIVIIVIYGPWSTLWYWATPISGGSGAPPNALLSVTATKVDSTDYVLAISHEGGDDLAVSDLQIQASTSASTMVTIAFPGSGTFSVGSEVTTGNIPYSPDVTGQVVTVYIIHKPSKEKIFSSSTVAVQS